jgi:hypothetical protein
MPYCVRCGREANNLFKGRFLCFTHFKDVMDQLYRIVDVKEVRESRLLEDQELVPINSPRLVRAPNGRQGKIRGQHFTISKGELKV